MAEKSEKKNEGERSSFDREEANAELRRNIVIGSVLRSIHRQHGTMAYLIQVVEPYLRKADRKLFGLPF